MRYFSLLIILVAFTSAAIAGPRLTPQEFQKIAATSGDDTPLQVQLASTQPLWRSAECTIVCIYVDGRKTTEKISGTAKTIAGKYIVFSVSSEVYGRQIDSIMSYDEDIAAVKIWGLYGGEVTEATAIYDPEKKIYGTYASYAQGDNYTEIGVGSFSDLEDSSHTVVWKNGRHFMVRDTRACPINSTSNKRPEGTTGKSPFSNPSQVPGAPHP